MVIKKRCLAWDWTNTQNLPGMMDQVKFDGPISAVSNWNTWYPNELKGKSPFRPMVRTQGQLSGQDWTNILNTDQEIIHYFNEPERAGISPQQACDWWYSQMVPLRNKGKKLVSPSCSNDAAGRAWIIDFMNRISGSPPDFLGLHYYGTDGNEAIAFIEEMHNRWPGMKVIVSEIASIHRNYADVLGFTAQLCNWMDEREWVFEYAFFGCMQAPADGFVSPAAQLMDPSGHFTDLMWKYMSDQPMQGW